MRLKIKLCLNALLISTLIGSAAVCSAQSLRQAADKIGLLVGAAVNPSLLSNPEYAATLAREFNTVEPENVMKWAAIEPAQGVFNFVPGDQVVAFAGAHHMKVRGHNLLWRQYNPAWLKQGNFTPQQLRQIMRNHILTEVRHYKGKVFAWDVVNEAIDRKGQVKPSIWYDQPGIGLASKGTEYVAQAFRWAHEADPHALLFYNDYAAEGLNAKSDAIYAMVKDFKRRGVPIDGIGLQMHIFDLKNVPSSVAANIARLTKLGVQVHITEMDVALPVVAGKREASPEDLAKQAEIYQKMATICAGSPGCTAFQTWGVTDRYSWIPAYTKGKKGAALLFDASYKPKPAYRAVLKALASVAQEHPGIKEQRLQFERRPLKTRR